MCFGLDVGFDGVLYVLERKLLMNRDEGRLYRLMIRPIISRILS